MRNFKGLIEGIEAFVKEDCLSVDEKAQLEESKKAEESNPEPEDIEEGAKAVGINKILKAAKMVTNEAKWNKELMKLGLDPNNWSEGVLYSFITPIITAFIIGQGGTVDHASLISAKQMLTAVLKSLKSGGAAGPADEAVDMEALAEAIGESLINRMVKAMVQAPQFQKLMKGSEKYVAKRAFIEDDLANAVKNALVMTLAQHDASLAGSLPGQAKRDTKKAIATV